MATFPHGIPLTHHSEACITQYKPFPELLPTFHAQKWTYG